jgi:hypothetical protein
MTISYAFALWIVGPHLGKSQSRDVNCTAEIRPSAHRDDIIRSHFIDTAPTGSWPRSHGFWHRTKQYQSGGRTSPMKSRGMIVTIQTRIVCLPSHPLSKNVIILPYVSPRGLPVLCNFFTGLPKILLPQGSCALIWFTILLFSALLACYFKLVP